MKKTLLFIIALLMIISMFAGCNNNSENVSFELATKEELNPEKIGNYGTLKLPIDKDFTEITVAVTSEYSTHNDSIVINELRRRTGLNVQITAIPRSTFSEKAKVLMASQDTIPDFFNGFSNEEIFDFAQQGAFEPVSDYLNELPNFKEIFYDKPEEYGINKDTIKNYLGADGKLYHMPKYDTQRDVNHGLMYRKDIFDKHNIKMWSNEQEFLDTLRQLKKLYPTSTPFASKTKSVIFRDFGYMKGLTGSTQFLQYYNEDEKAWKLMATDPKFKEVLDLIKTMYDEGLIDPEFLTATEPVWTQKMTQKDKAFVTWDFIGRMDQFKEQTLAAIPEYDLRYAPPINKKTLTLAKTSAGAAFKKGKKALLAMKLSDYLISESGARLMTMGVEGVSFEFGEDGFAKYLGFNEGEKPSTSVLEEKYGLFIERLYRRFDRKSIYYNFTEKEQEAQDIINNMEGGGYWPEDPVPVLSVEEKEICAKYKTSLQKAAEEFATKYVLGTETGDAAWNNWLEKAESLGAKEIIDAYNKAQARYEKI